MYSKQVQNIVNTFNAIKGDYEETVLQGVWHAYCDSGIMTDALSVNDMERCINAGLCIENDDDMRAIDEMGLFEINDAVKAHDNGADLHCVQCVNAILQVCDDVEEFFEDVNAYE